MWRRPALLVLYLALVVAITWLVELGHWWETGHTTFQLVNPLRNLSVAQIRRLLDARGLQYAGVLEKREIVGLLQQSGAVQYGELQGQPQNTEVKPMLELSRKEDFYEQIYDENETVWVVEVVPAEGQYAGHRILDDRTWHALMPRLQTLQVDGAVLACQYDRRFCARQGWTLPQLLLILPPERDTSEQSIMKLSGREHITFVSTTQLSANSVLSWLHGRILSRVEPIQDIKQLEEVWLNTTHIQEKKIPHMVYISELLNPPLLIAALGLRFSTRIKLASFTVKKEEKEQVSRLLKRSGISGVPSLVIVTSEGMAPYGAQRGETLTRPALSLYICALQPHLNDAFLISLAVANLLAAADFFYFLDGRVRVWRHVGASFTRAAFNNAGVMLLWLAVTALFRPASVRAALPSTAWVATMFSATRVSSFIRYHWLMVQSHPAIFWVSAAMFGFIILAWRNLLGRRNAEQEEPDGGWWSSFPVDNYLVDVLFRPMTSLSRPRPSQDLGLEEGMERLIERLATPDLWLHPVIPTDYMKELPMWRYDGWGNEDDLKSESETDVDSVSENESDTLLDSHTCCRDEECRLCSLWASVKEVHVCHRCAILKRKLERRHLRRRAMEQTDHSAVTHEKLQRVYENCCKTRQKQPTPVNGTRQGRNKGPSWLLSPQRLTELKWTAPPHAIESRICAICLGRYGWAAVLCGLPCGHNYHHACITEWLLKDNHHCPTCRWPSYKAKSMPVSAREHQD